MSITIPEMDDIRALQGRVKALEVLIHIALPEFSNIDDAIDAIARNYREGKRSVVHVVEPLRVEAEDWPPGVDPFGQFAGYP